MLSLLLAQLSTASLLLFCFKCFESFQNEDSRDASSRSDKSLVPRWLQRLIVSLVTIIAIVNLTVLSGHHLLMNFFGITYSFQFWQHVNWGTIELALVSRPGLVVVVALLWAALPSVYFFLMRWLSAKLTIQNLRARTFATVSLGACCAYGMLIYKNPQLPSRLFLESARAALISNTSARKLSPEEKQFLARHGIAPLSDGQVHFAGLSNTPKARNLIVIYLEAFDLPYTNLDGTGFKTLTPNLNALATRSTIFTNWHPAGGYTIAALFGTHCGTKLDPGPTNGNAYLVEKFSLHSPIVCFTDILKEAGFRNVFMGGASPRFSGKGDFLLANGYHEAIGREWFENSNTLARRFEGFGLLDFELFSEAASKVKDLHNQQQRFLFTLLTLNTHQPGHPQEDVCGPFPPEAANDPLRRGAWCTDRALGRFLKELDDDGILKDTAIWIQSDHPQFQTELKRNALGEDNMTNTRLVSLLLLPGQTSPQAIPTPASGFDFPASALDVLGVETSGRFQRGMSVFASEFRDRSAVLSDFGTRPAPITAETEPTTCPIEDVHTTELTEFPPDWGPCAFAKAAELASLDQQHAHARPTSITQTLRNFRFLVDETGLPSVTDASDPNRHNLLLYLQGAEFSEERTEAAPYALELASSGEILNVRKLQHNQELECSDPKAFMQVSIVNLGLTVKQCSGNVIIKQFQLEENREFKLPF